MSDKNKDDEIKQLIDMVKIANRVIHNHVVANQAAWIEWQHGKGAEAAMTWVHNGLVGPGHIPDESEPYSKDAQMYYNKNQAEPFPDCFCGKPSSILWGKHGSCCNEHMDEIRKSGGLKH